MNRPTPDRGGRGGGRSSSSLGGAAYLLAPGGSRSGVRRRPTAVPSATPAPSRSAAPTAPAADTLGRRPSPAIRRRSKASCTRVRYIPRFDPPLAFTIDVRSEHNCAPDFQCRGSIDANLPGWVDLEFGSPRIEMTMIRVDKVDDPAHKGRLIDPPAGLAASDRQQARSDGRWPRSPSPWAAWPATQLDVQTHGNGHRVRAHRRACRSWLRTSAEHHEPAHRRPGRRPPDRRLATGTRTVRSTSRSRSSNSIVWR